MTELKQQNIGKGLPGGSRLDGAPGTVPSLDDSSYVKHFLFGGFIKLKL